jgi:hypothetical protein
LAPGNTIWRGRLNTVDLLIKVTCFVKKRKIIFSIVKAVDPNWLVQGQGGQLYRALPFSKTSLDKRTNLFYKSVCYEGKKTFKTYLGMWLVLFLGDLPHPSSLGSLL